MKHRTLSLFMAFVLSFALLSPAFAAQSSYSDVPTQHWASDSIARATQLGIFHGVDNHTFGFGQAISRAAFVQAFVRLFGWETVSPSNATFEDVSPDAWYYAAVETAVQHGAIPVSGSRFRPTETLTRSEMVSLLLRALGYGALAGMVSNYPAPFTDVTANKGFIVLAYDMGIVDGVGNHCFAPNDNATREQAAVLLMRVYDKLSAQSVAVDAAGQPAVIVSTPAARQGDSMPTTPLEPLLELYLTLRYQKTLGQDMSTLAVCLTAGGIRTVTDAQGTLLTTESLTATQVSDILARSDVLSYYSHRYESAYCLYMDTESQYVTLWYQSDESLAVKLQLARMFDITKYILV